MAFLYFISSIKYLHRIINNIARAATQNEHKLTRS